MRANGAALFLESFLQALLVVGTVGAEGASQLDALSFHLSHCPGSSQPGEVWSTNLS